MSRVGLTSMQAQLLAYIQDRLAESDVAPSFEEMKLHLGLRSKSGVHRLITALEERGHISRMSGRHRAIFLSSSLADLPIESLIAEIERRGGNVSFKRRAKLTVRAA